MISWNKSYNNIIQRLISITHTDTYSPRISPDYVVDPIQNVISTDKERNEYFTFSRQQSLDILFVFFQILFFC